MKNKSSVFFWGTLFITIGILILLNNLNILRYDFEFMLDWWPIILIIWGLSLLKIPQTIRNLLSGIFALLLALLFFALYSHSFGCWSYNCDDDYVLSPGYYNNSNTISLEKDSALQEATLSINCGAYHIRIDDTTSKLIETGLSGNSDDVKMQRDSGNIISLDFNSNIRHIFRSHNHHRDAKIKLNPDIVWNLNLDIGASSVNCDLENFKTKNISIDGGASDIKLKLGKLFVDSSIVTISTGASSINIMIPNEAGCRISTSTGLSSNNFQGFNKSEDGEFQTENYATASKKIYIDISGGVSSFKVKRY